MSRQLTLGEKVAEKQTTNFLKRELRNALIANKRQRETSLLAKQDKTMQGFLEFLSIDKDKRQPENGRKIIGWIRKVPQFQQLEISDVDIMKLVMGLTLKLVKKGEIVYQRGDLPNAFFILFCGEIELF